MAYTYEELKGKTVGELREIAKGTGHESLQGAMQMNKEHLLPVLCTVLGVDTPGHHEVTGIDKAALKARNVRRHIPHLNHQIRVHVR